MSDEWRKMSLEDMAKQTGRGLAFEVYALRDIFPGTNHLSVSFFGHSSSPSWTRVSLSHCALILVQAKKSLLTMEWNGNLHGLNI